MHACRKPAGRISEMNPENPNAVRTLARPEKEA
jgi:hypothetical protein